MESEEQSSLKLPDESIRFLEELLKGMKENKIVVLSMAVQFNTNRGDLNIKFGTVI